MPENEQAARVRQIPIRDIAPNPHNPRRLFDDEPMGILRDSIAKLGVLVPVAVYERQRDEASTADLTTYVLLDGERRWRCVQNLEMAEIPAIVVAQPSEVNNILTMFHIHNVREGWQLMPTALKLQTLMEQLDTTNERELASLTQLSISQIRRCKILLSYDQKYQEMMLAPQSERLKADFFIELDRIRGPALASEFPPWLKRGDEKCIDTFLNKYLRGIIKAVTEFRILAATYRAAVEYEQLDTFFTELDHFLSDEDMGIGDFEVPGADFYKHAFELRRSTTRVLNQLSELDDEALAADEDLVQVLFQLAKLISERLRDSLVIEAHDEL